MISPPAHFHGLLPISSPPSSSTSSPSSSSSCLGHGSFNGSLCLPRPRALAEPSSFHLPLSSPASSSGSASVSSARERRKQKNERREQRKAEEGSSWKAVIDERLTEKKKGGSPKPGLQYELDMTSRLTSRGMQWWMVLVSARFELEMADSITKALKLEFPENEFEVFVPVVPSKRKMKDGSFSPSTKVLHSGCVFLRTVMSRRVHDIVRKVPRCRGFFGKKVGYLIKCELHKNHNEVLGNGDDDENLSPSNETANQTLGKPRPSSFTNLRCLRKAVITQPANKWRPYLLSSRR